MDLDARVPCVWGDPVNALVGATILVPHVDERLAQFPHGGPHLAHVGVTPFTLVGIADVEAAHVPHLVVDDEDLGVEQTGRTDRGTPKRPRDGVHAVNVDAFIKLLEELARNHEIREDVPN